MSLGTAHDGPAETPVDHQALNAELETVRRRFGHLGNVDKKLGQGAMGGVYRIQRDGVPYALKVLLPKTLSDDDAVKRFHREGELLAGLNHKNILKVFEVGTCGDWPYMLSELVDGGSVDDLAAKGPMDWGEAFAICEAVLEALAEVHKQKIYHRDIKPSNVLLTRTNVVKLADFGIAKEVGSDAKKTTTGIILGTPAYIAPEVLKGRPADAKSDLYAVGVLLFELIAGRLPWDSDDPNGFLSARLSQAEPPRLVTFVPSVPRTVDSLVQNAMNDNPVDRYPTAGTFLKALRVTRDRLVTTHGKGPAQGTARISNASLEMLKPPDDDGAPAPQKPSRPVPAPSSEGMRVTASRLKRPVAPLKMAGAQEPPSRAGAIAAGIAAALGVLVVCGIMLTRKPPEVKQTMVVGAGVQVNLEPQEQQSVNILATLLMTDQEGSNAVEQFRKVDARDQESAARIYYSLLQRFTSSRKLRAQLIKTRSALAVDAAVNVMTDTKLPEGERVEAALALHEITETQPSPAFPGLSTSTLQAFLIAMKSGEPKEIVRAAIETYGWEKDPEAPDEVLGKLMAAPSVGDWGGSTIGFSDPTAVVRTALERIGNAHAKRRLKELEPARTGKMDGSSLNPKKR